MKILVYPHDMNMGGSQLNAIELAGAVRDLGHEVGIVGHPGSLEARVAELGLEFIALPAPGRRPSPTMVRALRSLMSERGIDVIHGYEWPPALEGMAACRGIRARCAATVLSMSVAPFIPRTMPLMVGTEQIADAERRFGRGHVSLMEPPVDTVLNQPEVVDQPQVEALRFEVDVQALKIVMVNRLAHEMKLEGILCAIEVVGSLDNEIRAQLIIVGDGPAREEVARAADEANLRAGSQRVILTGELEDPRWAYQIADITLGMGGSALRAMAFAKPLIVQGEQGFWQTLTPRSQDQFLWHGWYGHGGGAQHGAENLRDQLLPLLGSSERRAELGRFAHELLNRRFSLRGAAQRQVEFYEQVLATRLTSGQWAAELPLAALRFARYKAGRLIARLRGTWSADDFNATATVARGRRRAEVSQP